MPNSPSKHYSDIVKVQSLHKPPFCSMTANTQWISRLVSKETEAVSLGSGNKCLVLSRELILKAGHKTNFFLQQPLSS